MFVLMTDFGTAGPYVGQMLAVLHREAAGVPVVTLFSDAPRFNPRASAYLLAAYASEFSVGTVFLVVIDPGVGTASRRPVVVEVDGRWFVGPDNGVFELVKRRASHCRCREITWRPARLSNSFHGRDLFAPVAASIARGEHMASVPLPYSGNDWPDDLAEIIYIDGFGNAMTGVRAERVAAGALVTVSGQVLPHAETFGAVPVGSAFWYANANGLVELAVNQGNAAEHLGLNIGTPVAISRLRS